MNTRVKFILITAIIMALVLFSGCTENKMARRYGGTMRVELPKGQKLITATWKKNSLFYLTEPMDSGYVPKIKTFRENSSFGILESTVLFIESK